MSTEHEQYSEPPKFTPKIPEHLLKNLSENERWLYERTSVQEQQNEWLMRRSMRADARHANADSRMDRLESRIVPFEEMKVVLTAKWSVFAMLIGGLFALVVPAAIGAWVSSLFRQ